MNSTNDTYGRYIENLNCRREAVNKPRVVYQGEPGAYSEMAAIRFFGEGVSAEGLSQFEDVFSSVKDGRADYGIVPIENTTSGAIRQVFDLLTEYECSIVGETTVRINHCLAVLPEAEKEDIKTVYSHEQGLFQCEHNIAKFGWKSVAQEDTAGSARMVAQLGDKSRAAICSYRCADIYGLKILMDGVNDNPHNTTRFVVVSPQMELRDGCDKICTSFRVPHESGSLYEILGIFARNGLNMVRLESRPVQDCKFKYMFFLEFTGNLLSEEMPGVIEEFAKASDDLRIFGNFKSNLDE